ncbi:MAG: hypothetical protein JNK20_10380 [Flavipsychrobacter sp.]|nr:hypothetical protein [Flavipsychrobacter sp.]
MRFLIYLVVLLGFGNPTRAEVSAIQPETLVIHYYKELKKDIEEQSRESKDQFTKVTPPKLRTNRSEEKNFTFSSGIPTLTHTQPSAIGIHFLTNWWEKPDWQLRQLILLLLYPKHHFW